MPAAAVQKVAPVKVEQADVAKEAVYKSLARKKRATLLSDITGEATTRRQTLGPG